MRTLIGTGEQQGGVYYFKDGSMEKNQVNAVQEVWAIKPFSGSLVSPSSIIK